MSTHLKTYFYLIFGTAVVYFLGIHFWGAALDTPTDTVTFYHPAAMSLMERKGYLVDGFFSSRYPPVFPLFLAWIYKWTSDPGTGNALYPYLIAILQSLSCGFLYLIARFILERREVVTAALLLAAHPLFVVLSVTKYAWNAMPLFVFLFFSALYIFLLALKKSSSMLMGISGFLLALSNLTWPGGIVISFIFVGYTLIHFYKTGKIGGITRGTLLFLLGFAVPVALWSGFIYENTGQKMLLSSGGMPSVLDGLIRNENSKFRAFEVSNDALSKKSEGGLNNFRDLIHFYADEFRAKPRQTLNFVFFKLGRVWYGTDSEKYEGLTLLIQLPYLLLGLYGILICSRKGLPHVGLILMIVAAFWAMVFTVLPIVRYMIPALGLVMIFAAAGLSRIGSQLKLIK